MQAALTKKAGSVYMDLFSGSAVHSHGHGVFILATSSVQMLKAIFALFQLVSVVDSLACTVTQSIICVNSRVGTFYYLCE